MKAVVFDVGNVLIRCEPRRAFLPVLRCERAVDGFMERTQFHERNARAEAGERFGALAQEIGDHDDRALFYSYLDRYALGILEPIEGSWQILERLKARGHRVHAITNWSAETWPIGLTVHPRLQDAFEQTLVSGRLGLKTPDRAIFDLLCRRTGVAPQDCLLIDDSPEHVRGAREAGWHAHVFTSPRALEAALTQRGLL